MPLATLHLLRLVTSTIIPAFIQRIQRTPSITLLLASQPQYTVIKSTNLDTDILGTDFDILLLVKTPNATLPIDFRPLIVLEYKVTVGIPSRILESYAEHNAKLYSDAPNVKLTGALEEAQKRVKKDTQNLELSPDMLRFMDDLSREYGNKPVTMLNLLCFNEGGKPSYAKYGQAFVEVAGRRGGDAKLVGNVVSPPEGTSDSRGEPNRASQEWWNEFSLVHYPRYGILTRSRVWQLRIVVYAPSATCWLARTTKRSTQSTA